MKIGWGKVKNIFHKNSDEFSTHRRTTLYIPVLVVKYSLILQCFCHRHVETVVGCRCLVFEGIVDCFWKNVLEQVCAMQFGGVARVNYF